MKLDMCMCCTRFIVSVETEREDAHAHKMTMTCGGLSVISRWSWESPLDPEGFVGEGEGGQGGGEGGSPSAVHAKIKTLDDRLSTNK